jgi:glycosyltransferase involved in cell wall biosynthesis
VPDTADWPWRARRVALRAARTYRPAAVLSSAPPHTVTLLAWSLAGHLRLPWVAELQDLWVGYPIRRGTRLRRTVDRMLEWLVMRRAAALVTVSEPLVATLRSLHPSIPVQALSSGIDEAIVAPHGVVLDPVLTILYTGRIYNGRQDLGHVLRALRAAIDAKLVDAHLVCLRLVLLHPLADEDRETVDRLGLGDIVEVEGRVPREESIARQRRAQILLHLRWDDPTQPGIMTGKIFEYLAARRPILSTGRYRDSASDLIERTRAGYASESEEETAAYLGRAFEAFRRTGAAPFEPDAEALEALDSRSLARGVAGILDDIGGPGPGGRRRRGTSIRGSR